MSQTGYSPSNQTGDRGSVVAAFPERLAFLGRQPILDRRNDVWAYQLLYRRDLENRARFSSGHDATMGVMLNALVELGLDQVVGSKQMLVYFPRKTLLEYYSLLLPRDRVLLVIPRDFEVDISSVAALRFLAWRGYRFVLSDVELDAAKNGPLIEVAGYARVDVSKYDPKRLRGHLGMLRSHNLETIAYKVETHAQHEMCLEIGFNYCQGYFLSKPSIVRGRKIPTRHASVLRLLQAVHDPDASISSLDEIIGSDVSLSYRLVRCLNTAGRATASRIETVRHALVMLGLDNVRRWVTLLTLAASGVRSPELLHVALVRARMCDNLAQAVGAPKSSTAFTVGLFSVLDLLLDRPMREVLSELPLSPELKDAIVHHDGPYGALLTCAVAYEQSRWEAVACAGLDESRITGAWLEAAKWARETAWQVAGA
ncbi:MAG: HDOD domain-containing protein [Proteobacteria bacterium]|nr:HDOD domain-containing protein [Pseudomonadota bacterium]